MPNVGYKQSLYFGNESNYGSAAAIDQPIGLVQSVNPTETNNLIKVRTLGGNRDYAKVVPGRFEVSGSFDFYLQTANFLRQAWGEDTATTSDIDSGPVIHTGASYLHIMGSANSPLAEDFPSFTLEFADDEGGDLSSNLKRLYTGSRVNSLSISASVDEPVMVSCDFLAQGVTISTAGASSVSESTKDPYVFYQGAVYATTGTISRYTTPASLSNDVIAEVNSFDLTINNNCEAKWYISGTTAATQTLRGAKFIIPKGRDYESSLGLDFADKTQYERFLGAAGATESQGTLTNYQVALDFVRSGTIGAAPKLETDDWIRIVLVNAKFADINIPGGPEDIVSESIGMDMEKVKVYVVDDDADYSS